MRTDSSSLSKALVIALAGLMTLAGCSTTVGSKRQNLELMKSYDPKPVRPVIVIPGFGNSKLYDPKTDKVIWGQMMNLVLTDYEDDLDLPIDPETGEFGFDRLVPNGSFGGVRASFNIAYHLGSSLERYGRYVDGRTHPRAINAIHFFAFDFRLSTTTNAEKLGSFIDEVRSRFDEPVKVDIVAHSSGGMIALAYTRLGGLGPDAGEAQIDEAQSEVADKVNHVALIGTPQEGTAEAVRALVRGERIGLRKLPTHMMSTFSSIVELLPDDGRVFVGEDGETIDRDLWTPAAWKESGFAIWNGRTPSEAEKGAFKKSLERARKLRDALDRPAPAGVSFSSIAGDCIPTVHRVLLRRDGSTAFYRSELRPGEEALKKLMFAPGDGSVVASSASGTEESPVLLCSAHHPLAGDPSVHRALLRRLTEQPQAPRKARGGTPPVTGTTSMESGKPR